MGVIGIILFIFAAMRMGIAIFNYFSKPYLPKNIILENNPLVSILIPVRNEENNIGNLLDDLRRITYPNMEIFIYNDNSTDNTVQVIKDNDYDLDINLITSGEPEKGWTGKNFACDRLSGISNGEYILFIDADVQVGEHFIPGAIKYMRENEINLLSVFPCQIMTDCGSRMVVPLINWILLSLLPLRTVEKSSIPSLSAANGQFMMFRRKDYEAVRPHNVCRKENVEDMAIIKLYKNCCYKTSALLGDRDVYCRMYNGFKESIFGLSRSVFDFFGKIELVGYLFLIATAAVPFIIFTFNSRFVGVLYITFIILICIFTSLASRQSVWKNVILIIPQHICLCIIMIVASISHRKKNIKWKGRNVCMQD